MSFEQLGLSINLLRAISEQGYIEPTPIQARAIPEILAGRDVMGGAQTGTGKTASFVLPVLKRLEVHANTSMSPAKHPIRAVILTPTRELAMQVHDSVRAYGKYLTLRSAAVYGGVQFDPQITAIRAGIEIMVATPGRLLDHVQQKTLSFSKVEILVLDEADRMLDMGFLPDLKQIIQLLPEHRQNLMFSATFSDEIKKLANKILLNPIVIEVAKQNSISELITHVVYPIKAERKQLALMRIIQQENLQQVLVFSRTKQSTDRLVQFLSRRNITCAAIHGDRSQSQRTQALDHFKHNQIRVLVATDVAARGLDIEELTHVINFELPNNPEDYVHRIGRTGRAGAKGSAISLVSREEEGLLINIEKLLGIRIEKNQFDDGELDKQYSDSIKKSPQPRDQQSRKKAIQEEKFFSDHRNKRSNATLLGSSRAMAKSTMAAGVKRNEDPLFTQPYISKYPDIASLGAVACGSNKKSMSKQHFPKRVLPALFTLPAGSKQK